MRAVTRPTLREAIARLAPGTGLRDGLERILRGRNVADGWRRASEGASASVALFESGGKAVPVANSRVVSLDLASNSRTTLV